MNQIRNIQQLNQRELDSVTPPSASWHTDHRHSAFIFISGLSDKLSEGDVILIFSQYGNPVYLNLVRDRETGKSRGFAFLKYEDQRSTDLAVDNLGGAEVLGRSLRVDHAEYKVKDGEKIYDNTHPSDEDVDEGASDTDKEGGGGPRRPVLPEERELEKLIREGDEEDPMREMLIKDKREQVKDAIKRWEREQEGGRERKKRKHRRRLEDGEDESRRRRRRHDSHSDDEGRRRRRRGGESREREDGRGERRQRPRHASEDRGDGRRRRRQRSRSPSSDSHTNRRINGRRRSQSPPRRRDHEDHGRGNRGLVSDDEGTDRRPERRRSRSRDGRRRDDSRDRRRSRSRDNRNGDRRRRRDS